MNETQAIRVAIFEDNPIMMDAYRSILNGSPGYRCTGSFTSCNNWKQDIEQSRPDVVLMDIEMTGVNGIKATSLIKKEFPHIRILIQTVFEDDSKILEALCAGANGYILKNTSPVKMLEAVSDVQSGGVAFNPLIAAKVVALFHNIIAPPYPLLIITSLQKEKKRSCISLLKECLCPESLKNYFLAMKRSEDTLKIFIKNCNG